MNLRWWDVPVGVVLVVLLAYFFWPARVGSGWSRRAACMNNVRQIGLAMQQYAMDHQDEYPPSLGVLMKEGYLNTWKVFICPSSGHKVPEDFPTEDLKDVDLSVLGRVDEWCDYVMVRGLERSSPGDFILLHEKYGSHDGEGTNCFFNDGRVHWYPRKAFEKLLSEQQAEIRRMRKKHGGEP